MPNIRPSADLRNNYNEISELCRSSQKPVFITKNGKGDVVVMSMELYDKMAAAYEPEDDGKPDDGDISGLLMSLGDNDPELGRQRLYSLLEVGFEDIREGRTIPYEQALDEIWDEIRKEKEKNVSGEANRAS